ncbi:hypothetical protein GCM10028808_00650 [Spirosoma migulaei]
MKELIKREKTEKTLTFNKLKIKIIQKQTSQSINGIYCITDRSVYNLTKKIRAAFRATREPIELAR